MGYTEHLIQYIQANWILSYRFYSDRPGHVAVKYKNWSADEHWLPRDSDEQLEILELDESGKQIIPPGEPDELLPDVRRMQNLENIGLHIEHLKMFMTHSQYSWWVSFLEDHGSILDSSDTWYMDKFQPQIMHEIGRPIATGHILASSPLSLSMERTDKSNT